MVETLVTDLMAINFKIIVVESITSLIGILITLFGIGWFLLKFAFPALGKFLEKNVPKWIDKIVLAIKERRAVEWALNRR